MTDMMDHRATHRNGSLGLPVRGWLAALSQRLVKGLKAQGKAEATAHGLAEPRDLIARDTGPGTEEATGIREWREDLPFFMQPGFGRR